MIDRIDKQMRVIVVLFRSISSGPMKLNMRSSQDDRVVIMSKYIFKFIPITWVRCPVLTFVHTKTLPVCSRLFKVYDCKPSKLVILSQPPLIRRHIRLFWSLDSLFTKPTSDIHHPTIAIISAGNSMIKGKPAVMCLFSRRYFCCKYTLSCHEISHIKEASLCTCSWSGIDRDYRYDITHTSYHLLDIFFFRDPFRSDHITRIMSLSNDAASVVRFPASAPLVLLFCFFTNRKILMTSWINSDGRFRYKQGFPNCWSNTVSGQCLESFLKSPFLW